MVTVASHQIVITPNEPWRVYLEDEFIRVHREFNGYVCVKFDLGSNGFDHLNGDPKVPFVKLAHSYKGIKILGCCVDPVRFEDRNTLVVLIGHRELLRGYRERQDLISRAERQMRRLFRKHHKRSKGKKRLVS